MRKSIVIATCIVNSGVTNHPLSTVEAAVRQTFKEDFQNMNYEKWNENLPESVAQDIIKQFGNNYRVDVRQLIIDLT
jgi:predicted DNA-binding protein (UPF0278 family)